MKTTDSYRGRQERKQLSNRTKLALLSAVSLAGSLSSSALGVDRSYVSASGATWTNVSHWSPGGLPGNGDTARVTAGVGQFVSVGYGGNEFNPTLWEVYITGAPGGGAAAVDHTVGTLRTTNTYVGWNGIGQYIQHGGSHTNGASTYVGWLAGSSGLYELNNGWLFNGQTIVGAEGNGFFRQNFGTHTTGMFTLGQAGTGAGTYLLNGGTLSTGSFVRVGESGFGSFTQSGGRLDTPTIVVGNQATGKGTFTQDGVFSIVNATNNVRLGVQAGSQGTYSLNFGTLTTSLVNVGEAGSGTMNIGSGTLITGSITIGTAAGGTGYVRTGGNVRSALTTVGHGGNAVMEQFGGLMTGPSGARVEIAPLAGTTGTYSLHAGTLQLDRVVLGSAGGSGTFNQTSGWANTDSLEISANSRVLKSGGTLNASSMNNVGTFQAIGWGVATFNVVSNGTGTTSIGGGGSVHVNNFRQRQITLSDGTLSLRSRIDGGSSIRTDRVSISTGSAGFRGAVDVADGGMMINAQTYSETRQKVAAARNGGAWDRGGITSRVARTSPRKTLGILTGAEYLSVRSPGSTFLGHSVASSDILVLQTYYGDTDFNGVVNFDDYGRTDNGFLSGGETWFRGDFNYDGRVNFDDYALIDAAFLGQNNALNTAMQFLNGENVDMTGDPALEMVTRHYQQFGQAYANSMFSAVPEPSSLAALIPVIGALNARRRRR